MKARLGFEPKIKAEPYTAGKTGSYIGDPIQIAGPAEHHTNLLIAAVFISAFLVILVLVALLFLLHRAKTNGGLANKHRKLQGSPISGISGTMAGSSQIHQSIEGSVSALQPKEDQLLYSNKIILIHFDHFYFVFISLLAGSI